MKMKRLIALCFTLSVSAIILAGCGSSGNSNTSSAATSEKGSGDTIKIGLTAPITGSNAEMGKGFQIAMEMAFEEINAAGGVGGKLMELDVMDSKGDPKEASEVAKKFIGDKDMLMVVGDYSSGACMAIAPIYGEAHMCLLSPSASNPQFAVSNEYMFTLGGRNSGEPRFNLKYLTGKYLGFDKVAAVYLNNDFGVTVKGYYLEYAEELGYTVTNCEPINPGEKDFTAVITKIRQTNPQIINIISQGPDAAHFIKQLRQLGWDVPVTISGGALSQQLLDLGGEELNGAYLTGFSYVEEDDEFGQTFLANFKERAGYDASMNICSAYDCGYIIKDACERALADGKTLDREVMREYLASTTDFSGVSVDFTFTENGDFEKDFLIIRIENGEAVRKTGFDYGHE